jgi:putative peptidoglycan lipid II flippase
VYLLASGFVRTPGKVELTAAMIRIMFPYVLFISLVSLAGGVLNVYRRFAIPAFTPVILNLSIIGAAVFLAPHVDPPITALAWGVAVGGVAQLALQIRPLLKLGLLPRPRVDWRDPGVRRVLSAMGPALLGVSAAQISILINTQLAALLGDGRISWITYADRLMEFPTALLGVTLGVVLLPQLSAAQARGEDSHYSDLLDWGLRLLVLLALPCAAALVVFAEPLVAVLYHRGAFSAHDVQQTVTALRGYGVGLLGIVAVKVLAPGFYARQDIRTPVRIAVVVLVATQAMNTAFVPLIGHAGLTLSIGLGALINAVWLLVGLVRSGAFRPAPGWGGFALRVLLATAVLGGLLHGAARGIDWIGLGRGQDLWRAVLMASVLAGVALAYFGLLRAAGIRPAEFMRRG